jgi:hypothetical protein
MACRLKVCAPRFNHDHLKIRVENGVIGIRPQKVNQWRVLIQTISVRALGNRSYLADLFEFVVLGRKSHYASWLETL